MLTPTTKTDADRLHQPDVALDLLRTTVDALTEAWDRRDIHGLLHPEDAQPVGGPPPQAKEIESVDKVEFIRLTLVATTRVRMTVLTDVDEVKQATLTTNVWFGNDGETIVDINRHVQYRDPPLRQTIKAWFFHWFNHG